VVLSLDWVDLAGAMRYAGPTPSAKVISGFARPSHPQTAGAWIIKRCRRSISFSLPIPTSWSGTGQGIGKSAKPHALPSARTITDKEPTGFTNEHIARNLKKVLKDGR